MIAFIKKPIDKTKFEKKTIGRSIKKGSTRVFGVPT